MLQDTHLGIVRIQLLGNHIRGIEVVCPDRYITSWVVGGTNIVIPENPIKRE